MSNYTQQCRDCHVHIEGTGEDICYPCLQRVRDALLEACNCICMVMAYEPTDDQREFIKALNAGYEKCRAAIKTADGKAER